MARQRKCLHCRNVARARGLCQTHYQVARRAITEGVTCWQQLIDEGWALEAKPGQPPNRLGEKIRQLKTTKGKP